MFKNFSIKKLLIYVASIIVIISSINIITIYAKTNKLEHSSQKQKNEVLPNTFYFLELQLDVVQVQQWLTDVSATRAAEGFDDGFNEAQKYFEEGNKVLTHLSTFFKETNNIEKQKEIENFRENFSKFYSIGKEMANTYIKYGEVEGNKMMEKLDPFAVELTDKLQLWVNNQKEEITSLGDKINNEAKNIKEITFLIGIILISFLVIIFTVLIKEINQSLQNFQLGLVSFFGFLNKETNEVLLLDDSTNNEIGKMSKIINENINKTKNSIEIDHLFIEDVKKIVNTVKDGSLEIRLNNKSSNENLEELRVSFNDMLETLQKDVGRNTKTILGVLDSLAVYDFTNKIDNAQGKVSIALNNVIDLITEMLIENKANGLTLDKSSNMLLNDVDKLNKASTETAASLEETAAALEEITATIRSNTENVTKMSEYAYKLSQSAKKGEDLATTTTSAMEDINQQVGAINEAITVIDQIAFQTNILSLNAAVEAATAGEAGKGFAVVAQEVRNLATRSAEAAKEIKDLVDSANVKANQGKNIAEEMILGYADLNDNISNTLILIKDIDDASKEQLSGIEQINDAVTSLDQQTQENVAVSNHTHTIAEQTDEIAKLVVSNANAKKFLGKDDVKAKEFESKEDNFSYVRKKSTSPQISKNSNQEKDDWESF